MEVGLLLKMNCRLDQELEKFLCHLGVENLVKKKNE